MRGFWGLPGLPRKLLPGPLGWPTSVDSLPSWHHIVLFLETPRAPWGGRFLQPPRGQYASRLSGISVGLGVRTGASRAQPPCRRPQGCARLTPGRPAGPQQAVHPGNAALLGLKARTGEQPSHPVGVAVPLRAGVLGSRSAPPPPAPGRSPETPRFRHLMGFQGMPGDSTSATSALVSSLFLRVKKIGQQVKCPSGDLSVFVQNDRVEGWALQPVVCVWTRPGGLLIAVLPALPGVRTPRRLRLPLSNGAS